MLVRDGLIQALGAEALAVGAPRRELPGLWLSPAPLDAHVHFYLRGTPEQALAASAWAGLAAVRDLGHRPGETTPTQGEGPPLVKAAGVGLGATGEAAYWLGDPLSGAEAFASAVRKRAAGGCGVIKLFASGLLDTGHVGQVLHPLAFRDEEVGAAVGEAHAAGLLVAAHANGEAAVNQALDQGVDCIEHGFFLSQATLARMVELGTYWSPTLAPMQAHAQDPEQRWQVSERRAWGEISQLQMSQLRLGARMGVKLVLGSDAGSYGVPHGQGAFQEMAGWLASGVAPARVYEAATRRAAKVLGLQDEVGGIFPGARAWLLATRGDPRQDPLQLARPVWRSF